MGDYNLSCSQTQGVKHASHVADTHSRFQGHSPHVGSQGPSRSVSPALPSASSHIHSKPVLINSVLSFIKAYRLKGDVESLKKRVCQHFSPADVENAKKELWDYCRKDLEAAGIAYHIRRGSDKRSQLAANVDDLAEAFVALDSSDLIPGIYCEATDLLRIPSLSFDPVSEKVETNTLSLNDLVAKVDCLEAKIASLVGVCSKASATAAMQLLLPLMLQSLSLVLLWLAIFQSNHHLLEIGNVTSSSLVCLRVGLLLTLRTQWMRYWNFLQGSLFL